MGAFVTLSDGHRCYDREMKQRERHDELVSVGVLGGRLGIDPDKLCAWARKGCIPSVPYGKQRRFDVSAVEAALNDIGWHKRMELLPPDTRKGRRRAEAGAAHRTCSVCKVALPLSRFQTIRERRGAHVYVGPSYDCRACRAEKKRQHREQQAERQGRRYRTRQELYAEMAAAKAAREQLQRAERYDRRAAERAVERAARPRLSREEAIRRVVARQRERYNTDPEYQARIKARKIRRKRAQQDTQVEPVNRELVAARDGWRCGICGKRETRKNWSLDHVVPLSKGGPHTYGNVVLAHRLCNIRRGTGRLPVQASLFADPTPPHALVSPDGDPSVRVT
jgi:5-methylcytosine-specific restriction endonuclease McrA